MNWLTNYVRPKLRAVLQHKKKETPDNLWVKCPECAQMIHHKEYTRLLKKCSNCGYHFRIGHKDRFSQLFDTGTEERIPTPDVPLDPLKFKDNRRYPERLKTSRSKNGTEDAVQVARGEMGGMGVVIAVQDFSFLGGSMGLAVGAALVKAAEVAVAERRPLIVFTAAGGARMQEGILALMQMPRSTIAVEMMREARLPYIVVLTDPTTGGVTASFAMLGDVTLAEPGALIGFTGPRVIANTIGEKLPEGFQRSEYLYDHGMVDIVVPRGEMRETLIRVISLLLNRKPQQEKTALPGPDAQDQSVEELLASPAKQSPVPR